MKIGGIVILALCLAGCANRNEIPANVQHSQIAVPKFEKCMRDNSYGGETGLYTYPNAMIECLYTAGFEIRYNGEPIRRVVSE